MAFPKGRHHTLKARTKMSLALKGRRFSADHNRKVSEAQKRYNSFAGKHHTEEVRRICSEKARKYWTPEHREEQAEKARGQLLEHNPIAIPGVIRKISLAMSGENHPFYGKKRPEHSLKMSGSNNPRWEGGHSAYRGKNWSEMREKALVRDNHECQVCGGRENLIVHHIKPDSKFNSLEEANQLSNLLTCCRSCHPKIDRRIGWQNFQ